MAWDWQPQLARLQQMIAEAHHQSVVAPATLQSSPPRPAERLRELASLREADLVTDVEFEAKRAEIVREL